jgi:hypothetical protein
MALKFSEYKAARERFEFDTRFEELCEAIAVSGIKFETYWAEHFLPALNEATYVSNEDELLNEIWPFSSKKQAPAGPAPDFSNLDQPSGGQQMTNRMDQWQNDQRAAAEAARQAARQKKLAGFQQNVDQQVGTIKQRFMTAMRDFLKAATDDAKTQNDPHMYGIVNSFYKKIMSVAEPVANEFKLKAKFGKSSYQDDFARERGSMAQNQMQGMKDRLQGKFGANPASAMGGSQPVPPAPEAPVTPAAAPTAQPAAAEAPLYRQRGPGGRFLPRGTTT